MCLVTWNNAMHGIYVYIIYHVGIYYIWIHLYATATVSNFINHSFQAFPNGLRERKHELICSGSIHCSQRDRETKRRVGSVTTKLCTHTYTIDRCQIFVLSKKNPRKKTRVLNIFCKQLDILAIKAQLVRNSEFDLWQIWLNHFGQKENAKRRQWRWW